MRDVNKEKPKAKKIVCLGSVRKRKAKRKDREMIKACIKKAVDHTDSLDW